MVVLRTPLFSTIVNFLTHVSLAELEHNIGDLDVLACLVFSSYLENHILLMFGNRLFADSRN